MLIISLVLASALSPLQEAPTRRVAWDAESAEHLLSRAGFGANRLRIERAVEEGLEGTVDSLFNARSARDPQLVVRYEATPEELELLSAEEQRQWLLEAGRLGAQQLRDYRADWCERLLRNEEPLRERMLLFWHGFFTTSASVVVQSDKVLRQVELLRTGALGSYADLLRQIVRDPAMLEYLDNDENRKQWANENLARELMELFSLGEGNYTEDDVKEAARALTGRRVNRNGEFLFQRSEHDSGLKTILGVEQRFEGESLVDLLLAQEACPRWVAGRLLEYFEGVAPDAERLASYAKLLRAADYEVEPFLRRLFTDPDFYRDEIVGARVTSPIDLLVGTCLRVGLDPPPVFLATASAMLGQELMEPPNVKGWEEGETWISTSSFMLRGNLLGLMLGVFSFEGDESEAVIDAQRAFPRELRMLKAFGESDYRPRIHLAARLAKHGATTDRRIVEFLVEDLLASAVEEPARLLLVDFLEQEREVLGILEGELLAAGLEGEMLLRRLAHLILSLPEGQLS